MATRREFLFAAGLAAAGDRPRLTDTKGETVVVTYGDTTLLEYRYTPARPKPYIHPLCLASGQPGREQELSSGCHGPSSSEWFR